MKSLVLLAIVAIAGCNSAPNVFEPAKARAMESRPYGDQHALRVKLDTARNRVWVLGLEHVDIYDKSTRNLIQRIALPPWSVADFICEPDIAFDRSGTAFISHNLEPKLWQIDPETFQLREHSIRLLKREHLDIGFGRLAFAPDGRLLGVASSGGSLWRIDIGSSSAHAVELDAPLQDCALH